MTLVLVVGLMSLLAMGLRPQGSLRRLRDYGGHPAAPRSPLPMPWPDTHVDTDDEVTEALLAARLMSGDLSAPQYRRAMAELAARAAVHRPMVVPPDNGH